MHFVAEQPRRWRWPRRSTELFVREIHRERIAGTLKNVLHCSDDVMAYFKRRLSQAPRVTDFALDYIKKHAQTGAEQDACVNAVKFKCNVLWAQLDALHHAYVNGLIRLLVPEGLSLRGAVLPTLRRASTATASFRQWPS